MSNSQSVANFYVDKDGQEQPIRYEARDLVNKLAPNGYHWEIDTRGYDKALEAWYDRQKSKSISEFSSFEFPDFKPQQEFPTKYICIRDKEAER